MTSFLNKKRRFVVALLWALPATATAFVNPTRVPPTAVTTSITSSRQVVTRVSYVHGDHEDEPSLGNTARTLPQTKQLPFKTPTTLHPVCPQTGMTLSRYMMELEKANPGPMEEIESIFTSLQVACKTISKLVRNAALTGDTGLHASHSQNSHGEDQKKLDVLANDILKNNLQWAGHFKTIASEEEDTPLMEDSNVKSDHKEALIDSGASYIAVFDPLDGSSNIDSGIPVGTIFGIFQHSDECMLNRDSADKDVCLEDVLQPGSKLVAAGYCLYSSATTLVFTLGDGTHGFTLDESLGEFVLTHPNLQIPSRGSIYSFNEGNRWDWDEPTRHYITNLQQGKGESGKQYSSRYVGSMVADVHRTLLEGGIFGYPASARHVNGKLRLLYEAAPMAFLVEQAGGLATTGNRPIRTVLPTDVHARVPVILGSKHDVNELLSYYNKAEGSNDSAEPAFVSDDNTDITDYSDEDDFWVWDTMDSLNPFS